MELKAKRKHVRVLLKYIDTTLLLIDHFFLRNDEVVHHYFYTIPFVVSSVFDIVNHSLLKAA